MKPSKRIVFLACLVFLLAATGCNYPGVAAPTPFTFPTPDLTSTAGAVQTAVSASPTAPLLPTATSTLPIYQSPTPASGEPSATPPLLPTTVFIPTATRVPPRPTNTTVPTRVSYEGPGSRGGPSIVATYLYQPPTIDGSFEEWNLDRFNIDYLAAGGNNLNGADDLSGNVMVGWDEQRLYLAARVKDDVYVQNASGENIFKGDSLEVLMDKDVPGDFYQQALSRDDFQLGITPGSPEPGNGPYAYLWFPQAYAGVITPVKVGAMRVGDGYRVEAAIPWALFGIDPRRGAHYGFAVSISDNDRRNENVQQSMVTTVAGRVLTDPTSWGDLTLVRTAPPPTAVPPTSTLVPTLPPPPTNTGVPTLPPPPTNTPTLMPTTGPAPTQRPGASIEALFVGLGPTLDGNLSEWMLTQYPINRVVYGADRWSGEADLSGQVMASWDNNNLYLGAQVFDGNYVQGQTGENIFLGDSLELLMDANLGGDFYQRSLSGDDFQLGISPGRTGPGQNPLAYLWFPQGQAGRRDEVRIGAAPTSAGYNVEVAIPWSVFGITPGVGQHYGFAFSISDNDNPDRAVQQSMVSNVATRVLTDPTTWGDLTLGRH